MLLSLLLLLTSLLFLHTYIGTKALVRTEEGMFVFSYNLLNTSWSQRLFLGDHWVVSGNSSIAYSDGLISSLPSSFSHDSMLPLWPPFACLSLSSLLSHLSSLGLYIVTRSDQKYWLIDVRTGQTDNITYASPFSSYVHPHLLCFTSLPLFLFFFFSCFLFLFSTLFSLYVLNYSLICL